MAVTITEKWICDKVNLKHENLDDVKSLSLPGSYHEKVSHIGNSLRGFTRLKFLDLSRNDISVLDGLDHLNLLETLNLYYNSITSLKELYKLRHNHNLKEIDIRLNPVTKNEPDYRLFVIHMLPTLKVLDDRSVRDSERKAALSHFDTDQAAQFEESPPVSRQKQGSTKAQRHSRADLVQSLGSRPSVLDDDDVALIDLMSQADMSKKAKSKYHAETYAVPELRRLPSPHAEKYARKHSSEEELAATQFQRRQVSDTKARNEYATHDVQFDHQPFVSAGHFTAHPRGSVPGKTSFSELAHEDGTDTGQLGYGRKDSSSNSVIKPERGVLHSREYHSPFYEERKREAVRGTDSNRKSRKENDSKESYVSSKDFAAEELSHGSLQSPKAALSQEEVSRGGRQDFLQNILLLVDKYWNGSGSLQTDTKFQATAIKLITKHLRDNGDANNNVHAEISKRDSEIEDLRSQLSQKEAENERFKKRLHNEEEIQRTIELADQDLRRLQVRIEEVQAENKELKARTYDVDAERKNMERTKFEIGELRRVKDALERENRTLSQQCEQQTTTLSQLQELTSMLQESHRSLVVTNDHLLQELDETRQRHQQEVQQLHWSYEQLKKTADWLPRSVK
ncbi:centrosomal protein of 72 kDa-like [Rhopilema esculentum]|uniref:centrosomal protein of 72 kDa-like n=1 Tax=Rhopilema esculentum TaxID=499914 RepID=UPI0031D5A9C4